MFTDLAPEVQQDAVQSLAVLLWGETIWVYVAEGFNETSACLMGNSCGRCHDCEFVSLVEDAKFIAIRDKRHY
jgi:hypothetical protein